MAKPTQKTKSEKKTSSLNSIRATTGHKDTQTVTKDKPTQQKSNKQDFDLEKLAHAVAFAETGHCADGTAIKRNNCHGIMAWKKVFDKETKKNTTVRYPRYFRSTQESFDEFKRIWAKSYKRYPDINLAIKWTGNDNAHVWLSNVNTYYNSH